MLNGHESRSYTVIKSLSVSGNHSKVSRNSYSFIVLNLSAKNQRLVKKRGKDRGIEDVQKD